MIRNCFFAMVVFFSQELFAQHTFSICAVDPVTGEVGSAGGSCIFNSEIISDMHPGVGVVHTQSYYIPANQNYAEDLMNMGVAPEDIIDSLVANDIFDDPSIRQYGVVDLVDGGRSAAFTGDSCLDWKGHLLGVTYAIQGNILLGPEILDAMEDGFLNTDGNLACKLMGALQGANVPGADIRCDTFNISSLSAFIRVAKPTDEVNDLWLDLEVNDVEDTAGIDPIDSLQTLFDEIGGCDYTGVSNAFSAATISVTPQPVHEFAEFTCDQGILLIELYDIAGNKIYEYQGTGENSYMLELNIPAGCYIYKVTDKNFLPYTGKLLRLR